MEAVLFLILPMLAAALVYGLRRWRDVPPLVAVGVCLVLGIVLLVVPFGRTVALFGREIELGGAIPLLGRALVMGPSARVSMAFLFLAGAVFFLLSWRSEPGELFVPLGLGLLGLLGGVLLIRPLVYAALLLQIAATLSVFPLHGDQRLPARGGLRYLTFFTLALPGLLVSHWLLDMYALTPDQEGLLYTATGLIAFSFALMLGVTPFHPWVPAVGRDGTPLVSAFLFSITGGVVWFLLIDYLRTYPWLLGDPSSYAVFTGLGVVTAVVGGLLGTTRRGPGTLLGYGVVVDTGLMLVALGQANQTGLSLAVMMVFVRAWGAALMAAGLEGLREPDEEMGSSLAGRGLRAPWSTAMLAIGGLSLAGFPLTVGFAPRWGLFRLVSRSQPLTALVLLIAATGPLVGLLRLLHQLLERPLRIPSLAKDDSKQQESPEQRTESPVIVVRSVLLAVATILLGLFPQVLASVAARIGELYAIFGP